MTTVRHAYIIKTLYWAYSINEEWIDNDYIEYRESLSEAIEFAKAMCTLIRTIESTVYSNTTNELMYREQGITLELDHGQ
jgi:hypothetical protein